ncbi:MAG: methyltransferase domain-containing protein [Actinomycetota bacterium]|nr:methyltransferase domain-containing protein [Actinomycetota bacterium]
MTPRDWDARSYDRVSDPMTGWGRGILDRLSLQGDERVLDAGCGTGRVTEALLARLPEGQVVAVDASPSMLAEARTRLGDDRVEYLLADLAQPLPLDAPVDAVFSSATFHWVRNHDALFDNLGEVMRPGGPLVAQCGGAGNIASVLEAVRQVGFDGPDPFHFAGAEETRRRLESAGFVDVHTWLHEEPTALEPGEPLEEFLATVALGSHLQHLPPYERPGFVREVAQRLPRPEIDYVRLNIVARRPAEGPGTAPLKSNRSVPV